VYAAKVRPIHINIDRTAHTDSDDFVLANDIMVIHAGPSARACPVLLWKDNGAV
jgi:hypothetical protein